MNDCIWGFVFCDCDRRCNKYLSANSPEGEVLLKEYQDNVEKALEPVKEEFKRKFGNY